MSRYELTFEGGISDRFSPVTFLNSQRIPMVFHAAVGDQHLVPKGKARRPSVISDIIDLAVAVYAADRVSSRHPRRQRSLHVKLPLRNPDLFGSSTMLDQIRDTLYWYTEDEWRFEFVEREMLPRQSEAQLCFLRKENVEVGLWSGGLDSLAGVYNRLTQNSSNAMVLLGTGANTNIHMLQKVAVRPIRQKFGNRIDLVRVPIKFQNTKDIPKKNRLLRARGFTFLAIGAACAYLEGRDELFIYENGIGAINLSLPGSESGIDHSRAVHPESLVKMGKLISALIEMPFVCRNPFLFQTKAEMCEVFIACDDVPAIFGTKSCDRPRRSDPQQCGCCSSCLLRRQALAVNGISDSSGYWLERLTVERQTIPPYANQHLRAMLDQILRLNTILTGEDAWEQLVDHYPGLSDIVDRTRQVEGLPEQVMKERLMNLYRRYVKEWGAAKVEDALTKGLLSANEPLVL